MITIRKSHERGHAAYGWLDTHYTFSFANYYDPKHMGFRALRVINEDWVQPGRGFGMHSHRDMEIVTYILQGALEHKDSMGHGAVLKRGEVQRITAGTGIAHSEFNPSSTEPVHLLQIWLLPRESGLKPSYEQRPIVDGAKSDGLRLIASPDGRDESAVIHQDAAIYAGVLANNERASHELAPGRYAWVQVARGGIELNGVMLEAGDGAAISDESRLDIEAIQDAEVLIFDLP